jgi:phosphotransferase system HPr (HPr) family protein
LKKSIEVVLPTENGLHARPATKFVETAGRYSCDITISKDGMVVNGKSVIEILTLAAEQGAHLVICGEGEDADKAVEALSRLVQSGFQDP